LAEIGKDIERPLGQTLRPQRKASRGIGSGSLVAVLAVLGVIGVSGAIALREKPFRKPEEVAVSTPKVTAAPATAAAPAPAPAAPTLPTSATAGGASIVAIAPPAQQCCPKQTLPQWLGLTGLVHGVKLAGPAVRGNPTDLGRTRRGSRCRGIPADRAAAARSTHDHP